MNDKSGGAGKGAIAKVVVGVLLVFALWFLLIHYIAEEIGNKKCIIGDPTTVISNTLDHDTVNWCIPWRTIYGIIGLSLGVLNLYSANSKWYKIWSEYKTKKSDAKKSIAKGAELLSEAEELEKQAKQIEQEKQGEIPDDVTKNLKQKYNDLQKKFLEHKLDQSEKIAKLEKQQQLNEFELRQKEKDEKIRKEFEAKFQGLKHEDEETTKLKKEAQKEAARMSAEIKQAKQELTEQLNAIKTARNTALKEAVTKDAEEAARKAAEEAAATARKAAEEKILDAQKRAKDAEEAKNKAVTKSFQAAVAAKKAQATASLLKLSKKATDKTNVELERENQRMKKLARETKRQAERERETMKKIEEILGISNSPTNKSELSE